MRIYIFFEFELSSKMGDLRPCTIVVLSGYQYTDLQGSFKACLAELCVVFSGMKIHSRIETLPHL